MSDDDSFETLLHYVERDLGFAASHYNESYLDRRVTARMRRTDAESYDEYQAMLEADPTEAEHLLDALSINVTGFFRNPEVWDSIREALRVLSAEHDTINLWSAACADGREPYSMAMVVLDDPDIDERAVDILATDISDDALTVAREGVYTESRTADFEGELSFLHDHEAYVEQDRDNNTFSIDDEVKDLVTFERHDLINGAAKSGFHLVTCRNLFIYIDAAHKRSMLETIVASIEPGGYFVIGKSETVPSSLKDRFEPVDNRNRIYRVA